VGSTPWRVRTTTVYIAIRSNVNDVVGLFRRSTRRAPIAAAAYAGVVLFFGSSGHDSLIFVVAMLVAGFVARSSRWRRRGSRRGPASGYGAIAPAPPGYGPDTGGHPSPGPGQVREPTSGWGVARTGVPAGWLPDPTGRYQQRYWSGAAWTEHVRRTGVPGSDPPPA